MNIIQYIKKRRQDFDLSSRSLATLVDMSFDKWTDIEEGHISIPTDHRFITALAFALEINARTLYGDIVEYNRKFIPHIQPEYIIY